MSSSQINSESITNDNILNNITQQQPQIHNQINIPQSQPSSLSNIHQLDMVQYNHQDSHYINHIPSDPFAEAAFENAMMFVPEISVSPTNNIAANSNINSNVQQYLNSQDQDQEGEMFDDIVANTNPNLAALPDHNLYVNHNMNYFDSKRNLLRASNSHHDLYGIEKSPASEVGSQVDQQIDFNDYDLDLDDNYSEYSCEQEDQEMLQIFNNQYQSNQQLFAAGHPNKLNLTIQQFNELTQDKEELQSNVDNQSVRNIQLHSLMDPIQANGSDCCGADDDFKSHGLDSTMSLSNFGGEGGPTRSHRKRISQRDSNQINSSRKNSNLNKNDINDKRDDLLGKQYVSRNAFSQMNYKDLQDEYAEDQLQYSDQWDEEDFEKMIMLQDEESHNLHLNRQKSAFVKISFPDSTSNNQKHTEPKTLLRTPQQGTKNLINDDEIDIIPISSGQFDLSAPQMDKKDDLVVKDTATQIQSQKIFCNDFYHNQQIMEQNSHLIPTQFTTQNMQQNVFPKQQLQSNIQYQFLKFNGFKPMNTQQILYTPCESFQNNDYGYWDKFYAQKHLEVNQQIQDQQDLAVQGMRNRYSIFEDLQLPTMFQDQIQNTGQLKQDISNLQNISQLANHHSNIADIQEQDLNSQRYQELKEKKDEIRLPINHSKDLIKPKSKKIKKQPKIEEKKCKSGKKVKLTKAKKIETIDQEAKQQNEENNNEFIEINGQNSQNRPNIEDIMLNNENKENSLNENVQFGSPKNVLTEKKDNQQYSSTASEDIANTQSQSTMILCDKHLEFNQPLQNAKLEGNTKLDVQKEEAQQSIKKKKNNKSQKSKYYQNFDFFFKRSCFRTMTEFYKDKFNSFLEKRLNKLKIDQPASWQKFVKDGGIKSLSKNQMDLIVQDFIDYIFGKDLITKNSDLNDSQKKQIILRTMMILFSHRHTKRDIFIEEAQQEALDNEQKDLEIDFSTIRDVMYKYSKKAEDRYFSYEMESFMFAAFSLSDEGVRFLKDKPDNYKDPEKLNRIQRDLITLKDQAILSLSAMSEGKVIKIAEDPKLEDEAGDSQQVSGAQQQRKCDQQVGIFLFNQLKRMTKGKL